jgi:hypothetical protein
MNRITRIAAGIFLAAFLAGCAETDVRDERNYYEIYGPSGRAEVRINFGVIPWRGYKPLIAANIWSVVPHKTLYIQEVYFEYKGEKHYFLQDIRRRIPEMYKMENGFYVQGETSLLLNLGAFVIGRVSDEIMGIFDDMEIDRKAEIVITQVYSLDDGPLNTVSMTYEVVSIAKFELFET